MKVDGLADAIMSELTEWSQEVADSTKEAVNEVADETVQLLKETSPRSSGRYARAWKKRESFENRMSLRTTVYNTRYMLTHLLENGHAKVNGGFVNGIPHIKPAEEKAEQLLLKKVRERI